MSISALKSVISSEKGYAKANRFNVSFGSIWGLWGGTITYTAESATLPGKQITSFEYPFNAMENMVKYPNGYAFSDVNVTFNLTNQYSLKKMFDLWMGQIINQNYLLNYPKAYETTVTISQLNEMNESIYTLELLNAYPITMNDIELSHDSSNQITKLSVTFTFTNYIIT